MTSISIVYCESVLIHKTLALLTSVNKKGFFHLLSANLLLQLAGFSSQFFVAGFLEPIELGRIKIMQSMIQIIVVLASIGLNSSVLKLCSEQRSKQEKDAIYFTGLIITLLSTFIAYFLLITLASFDVLSQDKAINNIMLFFALAIIPIAINSYQTAYLQAIKLIKSIAKIQVITKIVTLCLVITLTYYFNLIGFIVATLIGFFLTSIYFIVNSKKSLISGWRHVTYFNNFWDNCKKHIYYAKYSSLANVAGQVAILADILFLNFFIEDRTSIGQYAFALTLVLILDLLLSTIQQMCSPYFSGMEKDKAALVNSFKKYQGYLYIIVCFFPIVIYWAFSWLVPMLFGDKYDLAIELLSILLASWAIRALYALKGAAFWGGGDIKKTSILGIINLIISLPILYIGTYGGVLGVAVAKFIAIFIAYFIVSVTFYLTYYRKI